MGHLLALPSDHPFKPEPIRIKYGTIGEDWNPLKSRSHQVLRGDAWTVAYILFDVTIALVVVAVYSLLSSAILDWSSVWLESWEGHAALKQTLTMGTAFFSFFDKKNFLRCHYADRCWWEVQCKATFGRSAVIELARVNPRAKVLVANTTNLFSSMKRFLCWTKWNFRSKKIQSL